MKKVILILSVLIAFVAFAEAQTIHTFRRGASNAFSYTGVATDTAEHTLSTVIKYIDARLAQKPLRYNISTTITRVSGDIEGHTVVLTGSVDYVDWVTIKSETLANAASQVDYFTNAGLSSVVMYIGGTVDTVGIVSKPVLYPYYRIVLTSDGTGVSRIGNISGKLTEED